MDVVRCSLVFLRELGAASALRSSFQQKVDTHAVFGRTSTVHVVEIGAKDVEMVATKNEHRIGPKTHGNRVGPGDRHSDARSDQIEAPVSASVIAASSVRRSDPATGG
jgi:hypothetical protein